MKKNLIASLFFAAFTLGIANAQKTQTNAQPIKARVDSLKKVRAEELATVVAAAAATVKQNGISIVIIESGAVPCDASKMAVDVAKFAAAPNTPVDATSKGLDASIEQCCSVSTTGTFQLRTAFVDCNGLTITSQRTIDLTTACSKRSNDLMATILAAIGTPPKGKTYKVVKIKVWQN